ncbi:transposase family protein, partial [Chamaesiphon sp.]|uniref:transposase family protein n=1 Tax=Chamaesiphon sp. TaxID=2814140 RepID=UPI00359457CA
MPRFLIDSSIPIYCSSCKISPTEPLLWLNKKQRQTNRYQEYIYEKVKELTVKQVSENE